MRLLWVLVPLAAACGAEVDPVASCEAPSYDDHPRAAEYDAILEAYAFGENDLPGAVVAIVRDGEAPWVGAAGLSDLDHQQPMQVCTRFRAGSVAKQVIGVAVARLHEAGALDLDDRLGRWLPEAAAEIPGANAITLRQLLNHTSGLRHPSDDDLDYQLRIVNAPAVMAAMDHREKLERFVYGRSLRFPPGTDSSYANPGYWLLADVLEAAGGRPWREVVAAEVFAPAGMLDSDFDADDAGIARGYARLGRGLVDVTAFDRGDSDGDPAGGLHTTAADLAALGSALFAGALVSEGLLQEIQHTPSFPSCPDGDCGFGLGLESLRAYPSVGWGKNGSLLGADANVFTYPDVGLTIVSFAPFGGGSRKDAFEALWP